MVRTLLVRGMLVGILAGILSSGFAWLFGEPQVDHALWRFRLASLGIEAVLWTTLGLTFGVVAERHLAGAGRYGGRTGPIG